jgi:hypothetical protein
MGFSAGKSQSRRWPNIDRNGIKRQAKAFAGAPLRVFTVQLLGNPIAANPSSDSSLR